MKILLISGHGDGDPGASSKFGVEATETVVMVQKIKETLGNYAQVDLYPTNRNAFKDLGKGCCQVNFGDYDYVLEVHFNSCVNDLAGDGKTTGTEIYVTTAEKTVGVEMKIVEKIAALGLKNRGVKRTNWRVIARAKASGTSSALLEVCFIDDKDDMQIYTAKKDQIAAAVATAIAEQFGLKKSGNSENQGSKGITVGSTVTIKDGAVYGGLSSARGKTVPAAQRGGKKHTLPKFILKENRFGAPYLIYTYTLIVVLIPIVSDMSIVTITNIFQVITFFMNVTVVYAISRLPKRYPEAWVKNKFHFSNGALYTFCTVSIIIYTVIFVKGIFSIKVSYAVAAVIVMLALILIGIYLTKKGGIRIETSLWDPSVKKEEK